MPDAKRKPSAKFMGRLHRARRLAIKEIHNGCPDCLALGKGGFCRQHQIEVNILASGERHPLVQQILGLDNA